LGDWGGDFGEIPRTTREQRHGKGKKEKGSRGRMGPLDKLQNLSNWDRRKTSNDLDVEGPNTASVEGKNYR